MTDEKKTLPIDPRLAHTIDGRVLLGLLPHVDQSDLHEIRAEFARFLQSAAYGRRGEYPTWQHAWNDFIGVTRGGHGLIEYRTTRCKDCRHGVSTRHIGHNIARTGQPYVCGTCRGTGRGGVVRQQARPAPIPPAED